MPRAPLPLPAAPSLEVAIRLPRAAEGTLQQSVHGQVREAILEGRLRPGVRLPATRALARSLGVSRNTVVAAYDRLLAEGYVHVRGGAGTFVADVLPRRRRGAPEPPARDARLAPAWREPAGPVMGKPRLAWSVDFRTGRPDVSSFPADVWQRLHGGVLRAMAREGADYGTAQGLPRLRTAIAQHVAFARAVACGEDDVIVTAGAQQAFELVARVLVTPGRTAVAVEDPGYPPLHAAMRAAGARLVPVPVDAEGLRVDRLPPDVRLVCVTPSHQFPLGVALSARRRLALLEFSRTHGASVLEDDYDGEFRFAGAPLDALQTLDREAAVFYVGTFSKCLFPGLRLGFVVAPRWARDALVHAKRLADLHTPLLAQETLARFIEEGHLARHVRRMRRVYGERRARLLEAIARHGRGRMAPFSDGPAGLMLAMRVDERHPALALVDAATERRIAMEALQRYALTPEAAVNGLALGFGRLRDEQVDDAARRLCRLL